MNFITISPLILQKIIWIPTRIALRFFCHLEIRGLEKLRDIHSNVIFASNHSSEIDPILLPASLPFWSRFSPIFYTSRENKFYENSGWRKHFYGGWFFKIWGAHQVYSGLKDYEKSLKNHIELLKAGKNIMVFPEGRITRDGMLQPARGGVGYLVEKTKCLVVPVAISGAFKMTLSDFIYRRRRVVLSFGNPISQDELNIILKSNFGTDDNAYRSMAEYILKKVAENLTQIRIISPLPV